ncbi:MAG: hypothetical protein AAGD05_03845, partial [Bacteroidota bacterium]
MVSNSKVYIDLCENNLSLLTTQIEADVQGFLKNDLWTLYWVFREAEGNFPRLEKELLQLITHPLPSETIDWALVDEWTVYLFGQDELSASNRCRELLQLIYALFEKSPFLLLLGDRLGLPEAVLLTKADQAIVFDWLVLWMMQDYPNLALFLFGKEKVKAYRPFQDLPLPQVIQYLPAFMLWGIRTTLSTPQK